MTQAISKEQLLAQIILGYIHENPEKHDQDHWVKLDEVESVDQITACGTTACVSGYAVLFSNDPNFVFKKNNYSGIVLMYPADDTRDIDELYLERGAALLGLSEADARELFYHTNNAEAKEALKYLAAGQPIDWDAVHYINE